MLKASGSASGVRSCTTRSIPLSKASGESSRRSGMSSFSVGENSRQCSASAGARAFVQRGEQLQRAFERRRRELALRDARQQYQLVLAAQARLQRKRRAPAEVALHERALERRAVAVRERPREPDAHLARRLREPQHAALGERELHEAAGAEGDLAHADPGAEVPQRIVEPAHVPSSSRSIASSSAPWTALIRVSRPSGSGNTLAGRSRRITLSPV